MNQIISQERQDAILALANKRTKVICSLMEGNHIRGYAEAVHIVDLPVYVTDKVCNLPEATRIERANTWYDMLANTCRWLQNIGLTMTDHVPVYWYDAETRSMVWDYADELVFYIDEQDVPYEGQRLYTSAINHYALDVCDKLKTALIDCESEEVKRLLDVIKSATEEYL